MRQEPESGGFFSNADTGGTPGTGDMVHRNVVAGTATITLDSPRNRNALSARLRAELLSALENAIADDSVRVIVLTHTGPVFCSGMDLDEANSTDSAPADQGVQELPAILQRIWTSPKPVIAKLAGPARAGGIGIIAAADIAVATKTTTFAFPEVRIGVVPATISVTVLPRLNPRIAQELFLTGERFDAERALTLGLLTAVVDEHDLDTRVERYGQSLMAGGPHAVAATKDLLQGEQARTMPEKFESMSALSADFFASEEGREGIAAFAQKRTPRWVPRPTE